MAKHMTLDTRKGIAHGLECRLTYAQLATMHGRAVSTIANEVRNRMRRVLTKGASFDALVQDDVNLMLSHVNSSPGRSSSRRRTAPSSAGTESPRERTEAASRPRP